MTKRELFNEIINLANENNREDIADFATKEIALIDKRANAESKAKEAKKEENETIKNNIIELLTRNSEKMRTTEIANVVGISSQKATPILKALVKDRIITAVEEKRIVYYEMVNESIE